MPTPRSRGGRLPRTAARGVRRLSLLSLSSRLLTSRGRLSMLWPLWSGAFWTKGREWILSRRSACRFLNTEHQGLDDEDDSLGVAHQP